MKNVLLVALFAAMPLMAQECPQKPECAPKAPCCFAKKHCGPRPELSEEQKAEMKAKFEARKAAFEAKLLEKFDADKDGKLSDAEKEAIKADFEKNAPKFHKRGPKGPRCCKCCHGKRPELSEEQKAEMKAKFEARKAEMLAKYDADKDGKLSCEERKAAHEARKAEMKAKFMEKFDADKDGQISDAEKEAIKAECKKHGKRGHRHHGRKCCK
mgnify:CR=1 FL=1